MKLGTCSSGNCFQVPKWLKCASITQVPTCFKKSRDRWNKWNISVSCLVRSKAYICCLKIKATQSTTCGKRSNEGEAAARFFKKKYSWFILTSFCLWTSANNYIVHKLPYSSSLCTYLFYKIYCFFRSKWITIDWFQQNWNKWLVKNKVDRIKWHFSG